MCGKDVVLSAGCERSQLLGVEATFANMVISIATACGDNCKKSTLKKIAHTIYQIYFALLFCTYLALSAHYENI